MPRELRFPCAGCGRKTPVSQLKPVTHNPGLKNWWIDKRCEQCRRTA